MSQPKRIKDTVTLTREREYWGQYCNSGWWGGNIRVCPQFYYLVQSDESAEPYCEMWGHYLDNAEKRTNGMTYERPLRCEKCLATAREF